MTARRNAGLFGLTLLLLLGGDAEARPGRFRPVAPLRVSMLAYVGDTQAGTSPEFTWPVLLDGAKVTLNVLRLSVTSGGATALDIDTALEPYRTKFTVTGKKEAVQSLRDSNASRPVRILGYLRLDPSGRYLMLDTVTPEEPKTPTAAD